MKLLVVEDQEHILRLERTVLITDGFDVETAAGGREALEKLTRERYDGIVLDVLCRTSTAARWLGSSRPAA
jgi:DNA-binding response OmpR family regulator